MIGDADKMLDGLITDGQARALRAWADANALRTHMPDFTVHHPASKYEQMELAIQRRIQDALSFQYSAFLRSAEGRAVCATIRAKLEEAYELGMQAGQRAYYDALDKNNSAFHGAFLANTLAALTEDVKAAASAEEAVDG